MYRVLVLHEFDRVVSLLRIKISISFQRFYDCQNNLVNSFCVHTVTLIRSKLNFFLSIFRGNFHGT